MDNSYILWSNLKGKELDEYNKFIIHIMDSFFSLTGLKKIESGFIKSETYKYTFSYDVRDSGFSFNYFDIIADQEIWLLRHYDYPNIDSDFINVTSTPGPYWVIGYLEKILPVIYNKLIPIFNSKNEEYQILLNDTKKAHLDLMNQPKIVVTGKMIEEEKKNNLRKVFNVAYFNTIISDKNIIKNILKELLENKNQEFA